MFAVTIESSTECFTACYLLVVLLSALLGDIYRVLLRVGAGGRQTNLSGPTNIHMDMYIKLLRGYLEAGWISHHTRYITSYRIQ